MQTNREYSALQPKPNRELLQKQQLTLSGSSLKPKTHIELKIPCVSNHLVVQTVFLGKSVERFQNKILSMNNIHQTDSLPRIHSSIVLSDNQSQDWQAYKKKIDCHANRNSKNHSCHSHQHPDIKIQADTIAYQWQTFAQEHALELFRFGHLKDPSS